ncbi:hypothetical protein AVEN_176278-2 [Araneus ventricosus]|uniref:Uncharacterized protein n=2 Tax=Araneus ventricosus TaxID=182803 RepID=A0A4Y2N576_ARAVE|nr:hypothetical protein AVEN_176278-2 [Araneus ventricosus]
MDYSLQNNFNDLIRESIIYLLSLERDKIVCRKVEDVVDARDCETYKERLRHHSRKQIFGSPEKTDDRGFSDIIHYFQATQTKKKLFCRYGHYYLVKKFFTEGVQYVEQGEMHTYKAIGKPLDIYISDVPLDPKTFRISYESSTERERISPGETKNIPANTYYFVIARCHTLFKKVKISTPEVENSTEISASFATEANRQVTSVTEERNGWPSSEQTNRLERMSPFSQPSGSRDDERGNSRRSLEFERLGEPEMVNDSASTGTRRSSTENDRQPKRMKSSTPGPRVSTSRMEVSLVPPSPNSLRNEVELMSNIGTSNDDHGRAVFAIRKDSNIESYALRSDSTFRILQDNIMTGLFAIENDDMDPYVIEYHGEVQFIRQVAKFKNGSTFETTLTVQKDLLNELRDPTRKKEKIVVNYFFEFAFKTIEAAYKKFSEMRNTKMIGSCVPAIVPLSDARFFGAVSDAYEAKP